MNMTIILSFGVAFLISLLLVPLVGKATKQLGIIAHTNKRTIHHGIIPRTGGYAIYISFIVTAAYFLKTDNQINSMLIGGLIIFMTGFYDDIHDLPPKAKLLGQIAAALVVIFFGGISLKDFTIPLIPTNISYVIAIIITILWIIGITNAINLIDGLDGLCAGISMIVLFTIAASSIQASRSDIASLAIILAGAIGGFLVFNFHPAKIFMGDCGALFIGFMISVISLLGYGYKTSTFFTLSAPIVVLTVPMADTLIAIVRRKVNHKHIDEADRGHLHHQLMIRLNLGQTKSVLILYGVTAFFSLISFLSERHPLRALALFLIFLFLFELFIELTDMISRKYKPVLTIINIFVRSDKLPKIKESGPYKRFIKKHTKRIAIVLLIIAVIVGGGTGYYYYTQKKNQPPRRAVTVYKEVSDPTTLESKIYKNIDKNKNNVTLTLGRYIAAYFAADYYTLSNKDTNQIGGTNYFYKSRLSAFKSYAKSSYYKTVNTLVKNQQNDIEVTSYVINEAKRSDFELSGLEDYKYYDVTMTLEFNKRNPIFKASGVTVVITMINKDNRISVVALDTENTVE
jgi:UDP-N-acetylmuramyl pentapeptide phosphotransferase/UDP-N-acetylglucosamine-1-phosphate transferase